ncbi:FdhF/YdeP family oxidoreductase [Streptomyces sp. V3I7]|uniref:FdhF/YdeP family oxidoreductase n=1 Tax=Streptomyces sp. V3I7 TaxID=3042278 RepID=UPI00277F709D|nr:FdhF/YdeP family oxidoreductase [Streptomyces sp. V3I7]MDQ0994638.1 molybdopterin-dependent oxidoreductase alpha subunit [Streptomyces sp. V3I7]
MKKAPKHEPDERLIVTPPKKWAAGVPAVVHALEYSLDEATLRTTATTLLTMNQVEGIDCPGCAWADPAPGHRHMNEYCENGAKHINDEATGRRVTREFFRTHSVSELNEQSDLWLNQQGRLTEPMIKRPGSDYYEPISWHDALGVIADELKSLDSPDEAAFYTSGRASNESAFVLQLFARAFGTNNLPDCSNLCHETSGFGLHETLGTGKGTVGLEDFYQADLVFLVGQNPATNHPRQLSALEKCKLNGGKIISVNTLPEAGLFRFKNPQQLSGVIGDGIKISDLFLHIRSGGDLALFQGVNRLLLEAEDAAPGTVLDHEFIDSHTSGFEEFAEHARNVSWDDILAATQLTRQQIEDVRDYVLRAKRVIVCWAMGVTQQRHGVPTVREIVNFLMLRGNLGRAGAGASPVRGHSNVQGDRTMGVWEQMPDEFLDALQAEFGFDPPREHGVDSVKAVKAMYEGRIKVFLSLAGNFVRAAPDTRITDEAIRRCRLTAQISTKLSKAHTVTGETALILPCLGRTEIDVQAGGIQFVTVENTSSEVHTSFGKLPPASRLLLSEVAILCRLAHRTLGDKVKVPWREFEADYGNIRDRVSHIVPGFFDFNRRVNRPGGIRLPNPVNEGVFATATGKAMFTRNDFDMSRAPEGTLILQSMRSHDQWNTLPYTENDRYRGIHGRRNIVMVNPEDMAELGLTRGQYVNLVGVWHDDVDRRVEDFIVVPYPTTRGCAAAYYPEVQPLVPLDSVAEISNQPTSKGIVVRLEPTATPPGAKPTEFRL